MEHRQEIGYQQVKRNNGVAGIDQMPTGKFADWFITKGESLYLNA